MRLRGARGCLCDRRFVFSVGHRGARREGKRTSLLVNLFLVVSKEVSWLAVSLFAAGTVFVVLLLFYFLEEERYRRPPKPERGVGFVEARMAAGDRLSSLAPKVVLLAEKERLVDDFLAGWASDDETCRTVEGLRREVSATGFWRRFVAASALIEEDPARASGELRLLSPVAEAVLEKLTEAEKIIAGTGGVNGGRV